MSDGVRKLRLQGQRLGPVQKDQSRIVNVHKKQVRDEHYKAAGQPKIDTFEFDIKEKKEKMKKMRRDRPKSPEKI